MERPEESEEMVVAPVTTSQPGSAERELVREAQAFSQEAWARIYDEHYPKMFNYCYQRTGDRAASEDLASDVFVEALRGIQRYRYRGVPLSAWLYRIAHNLTVDHLRRNARQPTVSLGDEPEHPRLQTQDPTDASALRQDMQDAIQQLTEEQQQVIILRFFHGLSHEEIAAATGRRPGAVRVLQYRALNALRRQMAA